MKHLQLGWILGQTLQHIYKESTKKNIKRSTPECKEALWSAQRDKQCTGCQFSLPVSTS